MMWFRSLDLGSKNLSNLQQLITTKSRKLEFQIFNVIVLQYGITLMDVWAPRSFNGKPLVVACNCHLVISSNCIDCKQSTVGQLGLRE